MLKITGIKVPLDFGIDNDKSYLVDALCKALNLSAGQIRDLSLAKLSIDARKKSDIHYIASINFSLCGREDENYIAKTFKNVLKIEWPTTNIFISLEKMNKAGKIKLERFDKTRPVIVGSGPAGLFAALTLASAGVNPIVLERGSEVSKRTKEVKQFETTGILNEKTNVQFGEGGAGTYSDGKLSTGVSSKYSPSILQTFVDAGAPEEILWQAHPHIGTDLLKTVIKSLRRRIEKLGGLFIFDTQFVDFKTDSLNQLQAILVRKSDDSTEEILCNQLILAIGHSATDTTEMLFNKGLEMQQKPFSIGARIEHPQSLIDESQYGKLKDHPALKASEYKLSAHLQSGRSVYTFCMCPGGSVVAAASENEHLVVNGMSNYARDSKNANSAILVGINTKDFGDKHPLSGIKFQREIEHRAFLLGKKNWEAPAQLVGDLIKGCKSTKCGNVSPSYPLGVKWTSLEEVLPKYVTDSIAQGIQIFGKKIKSFDLSDAVLTGVETRSSSPVRILRNDKYSSNVYGIYPCGEGAGYAGGIMSSAIDGIKCALAVLEISSIL